MVLQILAAASQIAYDRDAVTAEIFGVADARNQGRSGRGISATYDYIAIGAGSAGCAIAVGLSEDPTCRVLLVAGFCVVAVAGKPRFRGGVSTIRDFFMPRTIGRSRTLGRLLGSRKPEVIIPPCGIRWCRRQSFSISKAASRACRGALPSRAAASSAIARCRCRGHRRGCLGRARCPRQHWQAVAQAVAPLRQSKVFQFELGSIAAELRAARAYHDMQVASHWRYALAGTQQDEALHAQGTQAGIWIATTCVRAADTCFTLAGGSAVYDPSPPKRRMRDLHAAAQYAAVHQRR